MVGFMNGMNSIRMVQKPTMCFESGFLWLWSIFVYLNNNNNNKEKKNSLIDIGFGN